jgi:hypothetical protein
MKLEFFFDGFETKYQISNFIRTRPVGAGLLHAGEQTDGHDEANTPKRLDMERLRQSYS